MAVARGNAKGRVERMIRSGVIEVAVLSYRLRKPRSSTRLAPLAAKPSDMFLTRGLHRVRAVLGDR